MVVDIHDIIALAEKFRCCPECGSDKAEPHWCPKCKERIVEREDAIHFAAFLRKIYDVKEG